jgi:PST family polysaccharide transporter
MIDFDSTWLKFLPEFIGNRLKNSKNIIAVVNNITWISFDKVFRVSVGLVVGVWITRYLGPQQYGLWSYAISFASLFGAFSTLGLDGILVKHLVKSPEFQDFYLGSAFLLRLVGGLLALMLSLLTLLFFGDGQKQVLILVALSASGFIFQSFNVIDLYFQAKIKIRNSVLAMNLALFLASALKVELLLNNAQLISFALAGLLEIVLIAGLLVIAYKFDSQSILRWRMNLQVMKTLLLESWPLLLASLAVTFYMKIDVVMLQHMTDLEQVGIYAAATRLSEAWYFFPMAIVGSLAPLIIRWHKADPDLYLKRLRRIYFLIVWLAIGVSLPLSLLSSEIISLVYGPHFSESATVLAIHLWASLAVFLGVASSQYLITEGLQKISFYRTLIGLVANIFLNLFFIPKMGAIGAAIATVVSYFLATFSIVFFKQTRKHTLYLISAPFIWK